MKIHIIAVGNKLPRWLYEGIDEYQKRFLSLSDFHLSLQEIPAKKRGKSTNLTQLIEQESQALINAVPKHYLAVALDVGGKRFSSERLAEKLGQRHDNGENLAILIGGPEGFNQTVREVVRERWSLSDLTLPHPIARLLLVETLYRSVSILHNHPYHRSGEQ